MNIADLAADYQHQLKHLYDAEEINALFYMVMEDVMQLKKMDFVFRKNDQLHPGQEEKLIALLGELAKGIPVQYLLGSAYFCGMKFNVGPAVLIPRPETEELVDWILTSTNNLPTSPESEHFRLLDIGTGSGCIAVSLKKHLPSAEVMAIDVSKDALMVAAGNAKQNDVAVHFIHQDIFAPWAGTRQKFDLIVSNPPYITTAEKTAMHQNVLENEPHLALFVSNEAPLIFYEAIAKFAIQNLKEDGRLFFEINEHLGKEMINMLKDKGFKNIEVKKDMQGKDRMICAKRL